MKCPSCGGKGPHYVPPSMGEPGFFLCKENPCCHHCDVMLKSDREYENYCSRNCWEVDYKPKQGERMSCDQCGNLEKQGHQSWCPAAKVEKMKCFHCGEVLKDDDRELQNYCSETCWRLDYDD